MMQETHEFRPDWYSPPGDTIRQLIDKKGLSISDFSAQLNFTVESVELLIAGHIAVTRDIAQALTDVFGGSQNFWLNRERDYRADLKRFEQLQTEAWISNLPYAEMVRMGWIPATRNVSEKISNAFSFFGVSSLREWRSTYDRLITATAFRTSKTHNSVPESLAAWLRQGELLGQRMCCSKWHPSKFSEAIHEARKLTRTKEPEVFLPLLQKLFAECGVALVVLKTPKGCPVSGAVLPVENSAVILLSFRYLSDDHFWFTLFHEAGHLLLHGATRLFLEGTSSISEKEEGEANEYSANVLIPPEYRAEMTKLNAREWTKIVRFAKKIGVSPGIVVGQLQNAHLVRPDYLNRLKVRYTWTK
ncbi:MAG: ImmA/IrrE family metallo-endopeptidase [Steroidobacter sp.]